MKTIQNRFEKTSFCHPNTCWEWVQKQLDEQPQLLSVIEKMEASDGEVIVLEFNEAVYFVDGYQETPKSRANVCFDLAARCARKKFPPQSSAQEMVDPWEHH